MNNIAASGKGIGSSRCCIVASAGAHCQADGLSVLITGPAFAFGLTEANDGAVADKREWLFYIAVVVDTSSQESP